MFTAAKMYTTTAAKLYVSTAANLHISTAAKAASHMTGDRHDWHNSFGWQEHIGGKTMLVA